MNALPSEDAHRHLGDTAGERRRPGAFWGRPDALGSPRRGPGFVPAVVVLLCAGLFGCAGYSPAERRRTADVLAVAAGWQREALAVDPFTLIAFHPSGAGVPGFGPRGGVLTVYFEGDGLSWVSRFRPSSDPTPLDPVAQRLALRHPAGEAVAYLGRPCQYVTGSETRGCERRYWTSARYGPAVIGAADQAVSRLKAEAGSTGVVLVGYSGGGVLAALVAARRNDVAWLVTVAANLDHAAWTEHHGMTPLTASLNPADEWSSLVGVAQHHYVGGQDRIVPPAVAQAYQRRFPPERRPRLTVMEGFDHHCCWVDGWPALLTEGTGTPY